MVWLLGEHLLKKKLITQEQLDQALEEQKKTGEFLGDILRRRKWVGEKEFLKALAEQYGAPLVELKKEYIDWNLVMRFPPSIVVESRCLPYRDDGQVILAAVTNPLDALAISRVEGCAKNRRVRTVLVSRRDMDDAVAAYRERTALRIKRMLS